MRVSYQAFLLYPAYYSQNDRHLDGTSVMQSPPNTTYPSKAREFWQGVRDETPLMLAVIPFGLVFGALGLAAGLAPLEVILLSSIVFGGASRVIFAQLWGLGTPAFVVAGSVATINLRHVLYSASISRYVRHLPLGWRVLLGYLLTDEAYAISINRFQNGPASPHSHYHLLGTGLTLWVCWQAATIIGVIASNNIPETWSLGFAIPLTFIAIVAPAIKNRADIAACLTASIIAILGQGMPWKTWIVAAAIGGILAGWLVHRAKARSA